MRIMAMMVVTLMVSFGCATTAPPAATATAPSTQAVASAAPVAQAAEDLRCEYRPILGSRVGKKLCYSEEEWALMDKQADDVMKYIDERTRSSPYSEGDP